VESLTAQKDKMQKLITGLQEGLEQYQDLKIEHQGTLDKLKQMQKEVAVVEEL